MYTYYRWGEVKRKEAVNIYNRIVWSIAIGFEMYTLKQ